ncbi:MAG: hypothetical protein ABIG32_01485 [Candidatus Uhrbacteria bacterium]|nr:hypothetical protein [Patescibacteria group bacterium]MBU1907062.1 hypothetical protein [Patescibacteria group bacterium]
MQIGHATNIKKLVDHVGAGVMDPGERGPIPLRVLIWDGRVVVASYYKGTKTPDVTSRLDVIIDDVAMRPHVEALLRDDTSFITETGSHDMVCTLEWSIRSS